MEKQEFENKWRKRIGIGCFLSAGLLLITGVIFNSPGGVAIPFLTFYGIFRLWIEPNI